MLLKKFEIFLGSHKHYKTHIKPTKPIGFRILKTEKATTRMSDTTVTTTNPVAKTTVSSTYNLDVLPSNIGAFIGPKGSNFKKMIAEMKKKILNKSTEIIPSEWSSVTITLKFEKADSHMDDAEDRSYDFIHAIYECEKEHEKVVREVLDKFVELHKKENEMFKKRQIKGKTLVYRMGVDHRFIGRYIGVGGSNVGQLKKNLATLPLMESVNSITFKEQTKRFEGDFRNIGIRGHDEHILMFITLKGTPDFNQVQSVVEDYLESHTTEDSSSEDSYEESSESEKDNSEEEEEFDGSGW